MVKEIDSLFFELYKEPVQAKTFDSIVVWVAY